MVKKCSMTLMLGYAGIRWIRDLGEDEAGAVAVGVGHARMAVAAFQCRVDLAVDPVELRAPLSQFLDQFRPLTDHLLDDLGIAQSAAGGQRVGDVGLETIAFPQDRGDAALGLPGVAVFEAGLADEDDVSLLGRLDGGPQAGNTGPYDHAVGKELGRGDGVDIHQVPPKRACLVLRSGLAPWSYIHRSILGFHKTDHDTRTDASWKHFDPEVRVFELDARGRTPMIRSIRHKTPARIGLGRKGGGY